MTALTIRNARVVGENGVLEGYSVMVADGWIVDICQEPALGGADTVIDAQGQLLLPGFIDMQVNGGGGVLFNDAPTIDSIRDIARAHYQFGSTGLLPTVITDELDVVQRAIHAVDESIEAGVPGILGIHIEGPFISRERRGVHNKALIRDMDSESVSLLTGLRRGVTLVTLAPEMVSSQLLTRLVDAGVIVAAGHSDASYSETRAALDAGLQGFTHLFNAMSPLSGREPGVVGAALEDQNSWCGMIVDGIHVHPAALKLAVAWKPTGSAILVTDAMPGVGSDIDVFELQGRSVQVEEGCCTTRDGQLAGSNLDMASAVRNAQNLLGLSLQEAVRMASAYPANALGLGDEIGAIRVGNRADFILADDDIQVTATWVGGHKVYEG